MGESAASREFRFESLVRLHTRFVFRVAYTVLRNAENAEDVVQETFLKLYRNRGWERAENERAFLARTAWRIAVDRIPKRQEQITLPEIAGPANPEAALVASNRMDAVHRLIDALPEELRTVLLLSGIDEMNSREIAAVLAIPEGTVRTRLQRARQLIKQKLAEVERSACGK